MELKKIRKSLDLALLEGIELTSIESLETLIKTSKQIDYNLS